MKDEYLLNFDLTEQELESLLESGRLVVMRKFVLENVGNLGVFIKKMSLGGGRCSAEGFEIVNCLTAKIREKESKDLDIVWSTSSE